MQENNSCHSRHEPYGARRGQAHVFFVLSENLFRRKFS
jgi:hypothetical protein